VRLAEANPVTGGLILKIVEDDESGPHTGRPIRQGAGSRGRGGKPAGGKTGRAKSEGRKSARR